MGHEQTEGARTLGSGGLPAVVPGVRVAAHRPHTVRAPCLLQGTGGSPVARDRDAWRMRRHRGRSRMGMPRLRPEDSTPCDTSGREIGASTTSSASQASCETVWPLRRPSMDTSDTTVAHSYSIIVPDATLARAFDYRQALRTGQGQAGASSAIASKASICERSRDRICSASCSTPSGLRSSRKLRWSGTAPTGTLPSLVCWAMSRLGCL